MAEKTKVEKAYDEGVKAGLEGTFKDDLMQSLTKGFTLSPETNEAYNKGYAYGQDHRHDKKKD